MALITFSNINKAFGENVLFHHVSFQVEERDKIGLVGVNGSGKTTLFKILTGEIPQSGGDVFENKLTKIGYMEQYACKHPHRTVWQEFMTVFHEVIALERELDEIRKEIEMQNGDLDTLVKRQHVCSEQFERMEGFYYQNRARSALMGLGFHEKDFELPVSALSGGQRTRLALCKILLSDANLLLLDEPTNHLDIQSMEWLEDFLINYKNAFLVISHDRYFLDRVTNKTAALENKRVSVYQGNYSSCVKQKTERKKAEEKKYLQTKKDITRLEGIVAQQRQWNRERNIRTAESKLKVIEKLEQDLQAPENDPAAIRFQFRAKSGGGNDVLLAEGLQKRFQERSLFENVNLHIQKGERIFLLGPNGCGKTTLLKILMGEYRADQGTYRIGSNIDIGYFAQTQEHFDHGGTIIDDVWDAYPAMTQTQIRNALAAFLLKGDDVYKEMQVLSGGERARVALLKLMLSEANFLILDEPTNHLDIDSKEALERALSGYDGTVLAVSHDRYFINKLADRIFYLDQNGIRVYLGNYDFYIEKLNLWQEEGEKPEAPKENVYWENKKKQSETRKLAGQLARKEEEIAILEAEIAARQALLHEDRIASDYVKALEIANEVDGMQTELETLYTQWHTLSETSV